MLVLRLQRKTHATVGEWTDARADVDINSTVGTVQRLTQ